MTTTDQGPGQLIPEDPRASGEDLTLLAALQAGDEGAFSTLIDRHHASMVRLAAVYVPNRQVAEEVAQEAWLGVIQGISRFEGRSSLKTWIFRILTNRAKSRGERESRIVSFSSLAGPDDDGEPAVDPDRFLPSNHQEWPGHWTAPPRSWADLPEERLLTAETRGVVQAAIDSLSASQRQVITLRDIDGWSSEEVCSTLQISEANQRVLLHRARSRVRQALEQYLDRE